jgi:predicted Na+-dependent transporter
MKSGDSKIQQNQMPKSVASKGSDTFSNRLKRFLKNNWLVLGEVAVICVAKYNPQLGASGGILKPEFFISKLGVFTIFFINGIALSIGASPSELQTATKVNAIIQLFNFGFMPLAAKLLVPFFPIPAFRYVI